MIIASVGNPSDSSQIPNNCNTVQICDPVLLLVQSLLLFLKILRRILLVVGTVVEPFIAAWDLAAIEHTGHFEHTMVVVEALSFDCIAAVVQTTVVV